MTDERPSIMVIDDDNSFRELIVNLLRTKKYRVVEARSAEEANAIFSPRDIALAIVDYRLAGADGLSWITQMRETGRNMPIIFVSGTECDRKTFDWLRNILRVSLIVKKPIIPAVFLEQIEFVLPSNVKVLLTEGEGITTKSDEPADDDSGSPLTPAGLVRQLMQIHTRLEVKTAIEVAQANYAQTAREDWSQLMLLLPAVRKNPADGKLFIDASNLAHKIKGTAGSLGLPEISEVAAKIEEHLCQLEPLTSALQDERWLQLSSFIASGQAAVDSNLSEHGNLKLEEVPKARILLVTADQSLSNSASAIEDIAIDVSGSLVGARNKLSRTLYDGAILDLNLFNKQTAFIFAEEIRATAKDSVPLTLILANSMPGPTAAELSYAGVTEIVSSRQALDDIKRICNNLLLDRKEQKPRILAVDDDAVLTGYLATVLSAYGMETCAINSPVDTIPTLESFDPDLVLLDVNMPALTGYEVCRSIRENEKFKNLPVLFLTGKTTAEARSAAYQAGANDFLNKPVLTDELLTRVNAQLDKNVRQNGRLAKDDVTNLFREEVLIATAQKMLSQNDGSITLSLIKIDTPESIRIVHGSDSLRAVVNHLGTMVLTHFRANDLRGRLGYEYFAIVTRGQDKTTVADAINLLSQEFSNYNFSGLQNNFKATFTAGLADNREDGGTIYDLLNAANRRLQQAQREQLGCIVLTG